MNRNQKEKQVRIDFRLRPPDKAAIQRLADKCGLSVSEYLLKRALGYEPRAVLPDAFFNFYRKLCEVANLLKGGSDCEAQLLGLIAQIQAELLLPGKVNTGQIVKEVQTWQPQASGPSKTSSPD